MSMYVVLVLMNRNENLKSGEPFFSEFLCEFEDLQRRDLFILMKADDIMVIHTTGVFTPKLPFITECFINMIPIDHIRLIRTLYVNISVFRLRLLKYIFYAVSYCCVFCGATLCSVIDDLVNRHDLFTSFLNSFTSDRISMRTSTVGISPVPFAVCAS